MLFHRFCDAQEKNYGWDSVETSSQSKSYLGITCKLSNSGENVHSGHPIVRLELRINNGLSHLLLVVKDLDN